MLEAGQLIGPYRVISQLGKGAMGEVWRARDERLDRYVALKVLPADVAANPERRARMLREARAAAAIRHPHVVTLFDVISRDGDDVLVMELVEGKTLSELLRTQGPPPLDEALRWIQDIAAALAAAHARGILHRDIKSANVMVAPEGVKVLDFGLAKLHGDEAKAGAETSVPPATSNTRIALEETMPSTGSGTGDEYRTHAGSLLGTPMYMAPEQIDGAAPDERSEVFSVGVLAYELLAGRPPYAAASMEKLFEQIQTAQPPPIRDLPERVDAIVRRALAKAPAARWPTMRELHDAVAAVRAARSAPPRRVWPFLVAAVVAAGIAGGVVWWRTTRVQPLRPGDDVVKRALDEYDVFYNDKALSSLRAALAVAPEHPRANAYMLLFGGAPELDKQAALAVLGKIRGDLPEHGKERALVEAAYAYGTRGAVAAHEALDSVGAARDRELAFWAAELRYRAGEYAAARDAYSALLAEPEPSLRGRVFDHDSAVLIYLDEPDEALRVGTAYRDAFPGEADAVAVYATTLAVAGRLPDAVTAAEQALRLAEGEDTLAGLAKVAALAGDRARAKQLYARSIDRASPQRRPIRRAALALLQWLDGEPAAADTVAPCLRFGAEAAVRERGACLFVAGLIHPERAGEIAADLDTLAAVATPVDPAYGDPASLARLVRARAVFFGGGCLVASPPVPAAPPPLELAAAYDARPDFYATYHVPFFSTWAPCEKAALLAARGDRRGARAVLEAIAARAPNRTWITATLDRLGR